MIQITKGQKVKVMSFKQNGIVELVDETNKDTTGIIYHIRLENDEVRHFSEDQFKGFKEVAMPIDEEPI